MDWNFVWQRKYFAINNFSLLNWREWIETSDSSVSTLKINYFSLLNWREWIETSFSWHARKAILYFSLLNWREWIETDSNNGKRMAFCYFSLLNWREWIETVLFLACTSNDPISLFLIEESGLKPGLPKAQA